MPAAVPVMPDAKPATTRFRWVGRKRRRVIEPEFTALERAGAIRDANRVLAALNSEVQHLSELMRAARPTPDKEAP